MPHFLTGLFLALLISLLAFKVKALNRSGVMASTLLGAVVFGLGGLEWAILLIAFFFSSSALTRLAGQRKTGFTAQFSKGGQRDAWQVLANGGVAGVCVVLHAAFPLADWLWAAFAGSLAAVNADTWATELGVLSSSMPRMITTGREVERGTSGGISIQGIFSAAAGALFIGLLAAFIQPGMASRPDAIWLAALWMVAGLLGSLVDSLLGATVQAIYTCPSCKKETERHPFHTCGATTILVRGLPWVTNDAVNLLCSLSGAILAIVFLLITAGTIS